MNEQVKDTITTWATAITAVGVIFSALQVYLLKVQIDQDHERSRRLTAVESLREWTRSQPPNAFHCIKFMADLEQPVFIAVLGRESIQLTREAKTQAKRCLSDLEDNGLFKDDALTQKGSSTIAGRVTMALNADENAILGYRYGVGDKDIIFEQIRNAVDMDDQNFIEKLGKVPGHSNPYPAITEFLRDRVPSGKGKKPL